MTIYKMPDGMNGDGRMRIMNRTEFLQLEGEHLFCKYAPQVSSDPSIYLGKCGENDFFTDDISGVLAVENDGDIDSASKLWAAENDHSIEMNTDYHFTGRDGYYDDDQLFLVYSKHDVKELIKRLEKCTK